MIKSEAKITYILDILMDSAELTLWLNNTKNDKLKNKIEPINNKNVLMFIKKVFIYLLFILNRFIFIDLVYKYRI